jgi:hypothetical protein
MAHGPAGQLRPLVPLRPLSLGEILDGAVETIRRDPRTTLVLGATVVGVQQAIGVPVQYVAQDLSLSPASGSGPAALLTQLLALSTSTIVLYVVSTALSVVLAGAVSIVVGEAVQGRRADLAAVWVRLRRRLPALLGLGFGIALASGIGLVALGIGAVFVFVVTAVAAPALVLEDVSLRQAVRRSWELTTGDFWRVLGVRALGSGVSALMTLVLGLPFTIAAVALGASPFGSGATPLPALTLTALGALVAGAVAGPFGGAVDGLLYVDRRMRAEGLDIDRAQQARLARPVVPA